MEAKEEVTTTEPLARCDWHEDGQHRFIRTKVCSCNTRRHNVNEVEGGLLPVESMTLTVAKAQIKRGDEVPPNTTTMLVMTIERLIGKRDDEYNSVEGA
jgi:hypothetical protein